MNTPSRLFLILMLAAFACGCDMPDQTPAGKTGEPGYRIDLGPPIVGRIVHVADIDEDGTDESLSLRYPRPDDAPDQISVVVNRWNGAAIGQLNATGEFRGARALQLDGSGMLEIMVDVVREDTLHHVILDLESGRQRSIAVATGQTYVDESGNAFDWRPSVRYAAPIDHDRYSRPALLTAVSTGYAVYPRGIVIRDLESGALLDSIGFGANTGDVVPLGRKLIVTSSASDNGATGREMTDSNSYSFYVHLDSVLSLTSLSSIGDLYTSAHVIASDLDADGRVDHLLYVRGGDDENPAGRLLALLDPGDESIRKQISNTTRIEHVAVADLDRDADKEIHVLDVEGNIIVYDADLSYLRSVTGVAGSAVPRSHLHVFPDVTGDAAPELVVQEGGRYTFLDPEFRQQAILGADDLPGRRIYDLISMQANFGVETRLFVQSQGSQGGNQTQLLTFEIARPESNGSTLLWLIGLLLLAGLAALLIVRNRRLSALLAEADDSTSRLHVVLSHDRRVVGMNATYRMVAAAVDALPGTDSSDPRSHLDSLPDHLLLAGRRIGMQSDRRLLLSFGSRWMCTLYRLTLDRDAGTLMRLAAKEAHNSNDPSVREYFLSQIIDPENDSVSSRDELDFVSTCSRILEKHGLDSTFSVEQLASSLGMSSRQLQRRLSDLTGRSPGEIISLYRLSVACRLLDQGEKQVKEIAHEIGFSSPESFTRRFRQEFGVPPTEYAS